MLKRLWAGIRQPNIWRLTRPTLSVLAAAVIFIALVEILLRVGPSLIPDGHLAEFRSELRAEIAGRLGLPSLADTIVISRDDGGPELRISKPLTKRNWPEQEPGTVKTTQVDDQGFCNPDDPAFSAPQIDLVSLGDSFIWCTAINPQDTWTSKLSTLSGYLTYNLAAAGIGVHEYVQILKRFGVGKSPKIVVMNIYQGNDLDDALTFESYVSKDSDFDVRKRDSEEPVARATSLGYDPCRVLREPLRSPLGRYSYASNLLLVLAQNGCERISEVLTPASVFPDEDAGLPTNYRYRLNFENRSIDFNLTNAGREEVSAATRLRSGNAGLEVFDEPLKEFVDLSREHGFVPIVTFTPSAHTAYVGNAVFEDFDLSELLPWASGEQRDYLKGLGEDLGYSFIDLTPLLQHAAKSANRIDNLLYFRSNLHLTPSGHGIVADAISRALVLIDEGRSLEELYRTE